MWECGFIGRRTDKSAATVYLSLGSNIEPERHLQLGVRELGRHCDVVAVSTVYRNAAVGFDGAEFLNAVVKARTTLSPVMVCEELARIHSVAGRRPEEKGFSSRTLDIDLLLYDLEIINEPPVRVPREDVLKYSFVLAPLAELAPDLVHPQTGNTISDHWQSFDKASHPLLVSAPCLNAVLDELTNRSIGRRQSE